MAQNKGRDDKLSGFYANKRVLVTGGLGFIGSNLTIRLVELGSDVTVLDSLIPNFGGNWLNIDPIRSMVRVNICDMRDPNALRVMVRDQDCIFHLAGQVRHGDSMRDPELDLAVNCISTINLVEACRKENLGARLLYTSTRQVYGTPRYLPVTEEHPAIPIDVNGINKLAAEYYHLLYDRTYGLRSVVLRLTNTYGPRQHLRSDRQGFVGIFIRRALRGQMIDVYGNGEQVRDFNYVEDVVNAILIAVMFDSCFGEVFNLGSTEHCSLLQFVETLRKFTGVEHQLMPFPADKSIIDIGNYYGDYGRFASVTGWCPQVSLEAGLERSLNFYRKHPDYWM